MTVKYEVGQVISVDYKNKTTTVQLCTDADKYIVAKGVRHFKAISDVGSIGYFVELNKETDGDDNNWYIISQAKDLRDLVEHDTPYVCRLHDAKERHKNTEIKTISIVFGKESGIDTFYRGRNAHKNGYAKEIRKLDNHNKNGYGLIGDFISLTNSKPTELKENSLYLDCSRGETWKDDTFHLFTVKDGKVVLIDKAHSIRDLWETMEDFLTERDGVSLYQLFERVTSLTNDKTILNEFADFLKEYTTAYNRINGIEDFIEYKMVCEIHHKPIEEMEQIL